jgi:hypothetical protein
MDAITLHTLYVSLGNARAVGRSSSSSSMLCGLSLVTHGQTSKCVMACQWTEQTQLQLQLPGTLKTDHCAAGTAGKQCPGEHTCMRCMMHSCTASMRQGHTVQRAAGGRVSWAWLQSWLLLRVPLSIAVQTVQQWLVALLPNVDMNVQHHDPNTHRHSVRHMQQLWGVWHPLYLRHW